MADHPCHAANCTKEIPPSKFMCFIHWRMLPKAIKDNVWDNYVPGQEILKNPTPEYLAAARNAIDWLERKGAATPLKQR